jgi:hypothetical protein
MTKKSYELTAEQRIDWMINAILDIIEVISYLNIETLSVDEKNEGLNSEAYLIVSADILYRLFDMMWIYGEENNIFQSIEPFKYDVDHDKLFEEIQDLDLIHIFSDKQVFMRNIFLVGEYTAKLNRTVGRHRMSCFIDYKLVLLLMKTNNFDKALTKLQKDVLFYQKNGWSELFCSNLFYICKCYKA